MKKLILALALVGSCKEEDAANDYPVNNNDVPLENKVVNIQYRNQVISAVKDEEGNYLIDEDIVIPKNEVKEIGNRSLTSKMSDWDQTNNITIYLWPTKTLSFEIDEAIPNTQKLFIDQAIKEWNDKTVIKFVKAPAGSFHVDIYIKKVASGCSSNLGATPDRATRMVNLSETCDKQSIIHELGHIVGLRHEHQRVNRDTYITMQNNTFEYIKSNYPTEKYNSVKNNLQKESSNLQDPYRFDMQSAMMYGSYPRNDKNMEADLIQKKLPFYTDKSGNDVPRPQYGLTGKDMNLVYYYYSEKN